MCFKVLEIELMFSLLFVNLGMTKIFVFVGICE